MLLIFDCDGVVVDSMPLHCEIEAKAYNDCGISVTPEDLSRRFGGVRQDEISRILEEESGCVVPDDIEAVMNQKRQLAFPSRLKPMPNIQLALKQLDDIPVAIASGSDTEELMQMLKIIQLYDVFAPYIFSSQMVKRGKPAPDVFLLAAEKRGIAPSNCIVIEDGVPGVKGRLAAGMRVFGFTGGSHCDSKHARRLLDAGAELVFWNMLELPSLVKKVF